MNAQLVLWEERLMLVLKLPDDDYVIAMDEVKYLHGNEGETLVHWVSADVPLLVPVELSALLSALTVSGPVLKKGSS